MRIGVCTISTIGIAGLFTLLSLLDTEASKKTIILGIIMGAALGLGGSYFLTDDCYLSENYKILIINHSIAELREKKEAMLSEIVQLFNKDGIPNLEAEKNNLSNRIEVLAQAFSYIEELESYIMKEYYSTSKEALIYGKSELYRQQKADDELKYGYSLVKTFLQTK